MLYPLGDLHFEEAVDIFAETVRLGVKHGADLIFIETMNDSYETKAALLAAKENSDLPVFVSNAYGEDGKLMTGATPSAMVAMLEGMGADAIGVNCSLGPKALMPVIGEYLKYSSIPVIVKPNAGMPVVRDGETCYDLTSEEFSDDLKKMMELGVRVVGGCCGTTPQYISNLVEKTGTLSPVAIQKKNYKLVSSYTHAVEFDKRPILIGERINPTGKPKLKDALRRGDFEYILREAIAEEEAGADILDVNVGLPDIDEKEMLCQSVCRIQEVCDLPLQIDSADPVAMEWALRYYNGKAMINSANGKAESMAAVFPLVKKYGGVVVCLTLDENGIPETAEGRFAIAKKIYDEAARYGIEPKDLIFDPLAMSVSADKNAARETLRAVRLISEELRCHTSLGISNVSFGLPNRDQINAMFFTMALENGLSAAIINPHSAEIMKAYRAYNALSGFDDNFEEYISLVSEEKIVTQPVDSLKRAIVKGLKDQAADMTGRLLEEKAPLDLVNEDIIPALDEVGDGYEKKILYLPNLLMAAEAASAAFGIIKEKMPADKTQSKARIILATVKGDIHDIGKNILKLILENYGYEVIDLGKDVEPCRIVSAAVERSADFVGLSALMTTTLPSMETTVMLLRESLPTCRIMVGGAVLTEEYAKKIGANFYGKDAMDAVKYLENVK
jgi:5-methyltetrahydrofolate--homocysteine methyltransferase